jgi:hypothetical protein
MSLPERGSLDAGREKRCLALIVCDRRRLALGTKQIKRDALSREERQEILGGECLYPVCKFALAAAGVLDAQLLRHVNRCTPVWSEHVGR